MSVEPQEIVSTHATRSPARAQRIAQRRAQITLSRILARTGPRFERRLAEGLGFDFDTGNPLTHSAAGPMAAFAACRECKRPFVQEWAIREVGALLRAALVKPDAAEHLLGLLGTSLDVAQRAVSAYQNAQGADTAALIESSKEFLERQGYTVLAPQAKVNGNGGENGHAAE